jgi:hypothetical protein
MKSVLDLTKAITDNDYFKEQFKDSGLEKNILFVEPQLTSKHLYKYIIPFFSYYNENVYTAITGLDKYDPYKQIVSLNTNLNQKQIKWANYIVFPFTTMDLSKEYGIYEAIREVNPNCKIVFFVDFNFYDMPDDHPHKELFSFPNILEATEKNILLSDLCLTNNMILYQFLLKKLAKVVDEKYSYIEDIPVNFGCFPYLIDEQIVLQNVDFDFNKPEPVINKDIFKKVAEVAEEIKKEDLDNNKEKAEKLENKNAIPKKSETKTKKVQGKRGRPKKDEDIEQQENVVENIENIEVLDKPELSEPIKQEEPIKENLPKKYRIGIICSNGNYGDIKYYNDEFQKINDKYGDDVSLIFIGYDYEEDNQKILDGVNFEYTKQVSIIHYFKQLQSLNLDLVFVPLRKNNFNISSEGLNKYLECSLFKIPIIVEDMFPYNQLIVNQRNGFLYKEKTNFIPELDAILKNTDLIKNVSQDCRKDVIKNYTYNDRTMEVMNSIYI